MADFSDVSNMLAAIVAGLLYPNGTEEPSVTGDAYSIYPGWPQPGCLDDALKGGKVHVTVYPVMGERNVTRYPEEMRELSRAAKTITATVGDNTVTLSGSIATPQNVSVLANGKAVSYAVQEGDTLSTVAAGLATLLTAVDVAASSSGAVVTIAEPDRPIRVNMGITGQLWVELKRQTKQFMITIWAPSHGKRTAAAKVIDPGLAARKWIMLPDYMHGRNIYVRGDDIDDAQEVLLYRRDLVYEVEYPTIEIVEADEVTVVEHNIGAAQTDEPPVFQVNAGGE